MPEFTESKKRHWVEEITYILMLGDAISEKFFDYCVLNGHITSETDVEDWCWDWGWFTEYTKNVVIERLKPVFGVFTKRYVEYVEDIYGPWEDPECDEEADLQWKEQFIAFSTEYQNYIDYGVDKKRQMTLPLNYFEKSEKKT